MPLTKQNRFIGRALLLVACFCLFSIAQVVRPLRSIGHDDAAAITTLQQHLTRHAMQEVSPQNAELPALYCVGLLPVGVRPHCFPPRMSMRVPAWPMENWPIHRRISPASADSPEPA